MPARPIGPRAPLRSNTRRCAVYDVSTVSINPPATLPPTSPTTASANTNRNSYIQFAPPPIPIPSTTTSQTRPPLLSASTASSASSDSSFPGSHASYRAARTLSNSSIELSAPQMKRTVSSSTTQTNRTSTQSSSSLVNSYPAQPKGPCTCSICERQRRRMSTESTGGT